MTAAFWTKISKSACAQTTTTMKTTREVTLGNLGSSLLFFDVLRIPSHSLNFLMKT